MSVVKTSSGHVFRRNSHFLRRRVPVIPGQAPALQPSWDAKQQQNRATPSSRAAVVAAAAKPCPAARPYPAASSCPAASSGPATTSQQTPKPLPRRRVGQVGRSVWRHQLIILSHWLSWFCICVLTLYACMLAKTNLVSCWKGACDDSSPRHICMSTYVTYAGVDTSRDHSL